MARRQARARAGEQNKVLTAILEFTVGEEAKQQFLNETQAVGAQLDNLGIKAKELREAMASGAAGEEGSFGYAWLQMQLSDVQKQAEALQAQLETGLNETVVATSRQLEESAKRTATLSEQIADYGRQATQVGGQMLGLGPMGQFAPVQQLQSLTNLTGMMDNYLRQAGMASEQGRRWLAAQEDIEESQLRIGQVASEALVPFMETVAGLAERAAEFVEEHPDLIRSFVTVGGILVSAGTLAGVLSKGVSLVADAKTILAAQLQNQAADKQIVAAQQQGAAAATGGMGGLAGTAMKGLGAVALTASAVYIGGQVADKVADQLGPMIYGSETWEQYRGEDPALKKAAQTVKDFAGAAVAAWGAIGAQIQESLGFVDAADESRRNVAELAVKISEFGNKAKEAAKDVEEATQVITQQDLDQFIRYRQQVETVDKKLVADRIQIAEDYAEQSIAAEQRYTESRRSLIEGLQDRWTAEDEATAWNEYISKRRKDRQDRLALEQHLEGLVEMEEQYRKSRKQKIEAYQEAVVEMEKDHRDALEELRENYDERQQDAIRARDAIRYLQNMRDYEKQRDKLLEQQEEQAADKEEQHRESLDEDEERHREAMEAKQEQWEETQEAAREQAEFEREIAAEQLSHRRELELQALNEQLADLEDSHEKEMAELAQQKEKKLADLRDWHVKERESLNQQLGDSLFEERGLKEKYYATMQTDLETWMATYRSTWRSGLYQMPSTPISPGGGTTVTSTPSTGTSTLGGGRRRPGLYRQEGGYAGFGEYMLGEMGTEFVLSAAATRQAERLAGASLTQERVLGAMQGSSVIVDQSGWTIGPGVSPGLVATIRSEAEKAAYDAFTKVMEGYP